MLPHPNGESQSIAAAFHNISLGLHHLDAQELDDSSRAWVAIIQDFINTSGLTDIDGRGLWLVKAEQLTFEQKYELSSTVNELANWFAIK